ncbi:MAG: SEC-C domain-containing protein [Hyphomicrobiales bacterium]|nr:SEC-C domain-containing protein [Hyphomicrobiales bacterium]
MKIAAITMVFNEGVFLPIWLKHYGDAFGLDNLYVIDDGSTDGSTSADAGYHCLRRAKVPFDEDDRATLVSRFHQELLRHYDAVLYTDVDELIVVDPKVGKPLRDYLAEHPFDYKNAVGFNVVHHPATEAPIDVERPLFAQRKYLEFDFDYSKPAIAKVPMEWEPGFHFTRARVANYDPSLILFHLRAMDLGVATARLQALRTMEWSQNALAKKHSTQLRFSEPDFVQHVFTVTDEAIAGAHADFEFLETALLDKALYEQRRSNIFVRVPSRFEHAINLTGALPPVQPCATQAASSGLTRQGVARMFATALDGMVAGKPDRGRNEPCPCGSGKRFKHCHGAFTQKLMARVSQSWSGQARAF